MTYAEDPQFWNRQDRLDEIVPTIEALSDADRDFGLVAVDARANRILVFRRIRDVDRAVAESVYREVVPSDVGVEFPAALLTASEHDLIFESIRGFTGRLRSRGFRVVTIGGRIPGGPIVVTYLRAPQPLTFEILVAMGVTAGWPDDAIERGTVVLEMSPESPLPQWNRLGRVSRG